MNKDLLAIFEYLEREKGIKRDVIVKAIEESLIVAAHKSVEGASNVTVSINPKTAAISVLSEKEIVDEVTNPAREISLEEAQELDPDCQLEQFIDVEVTPKDFGRIAAQKARQIIIQKLRTAERDVIHDEYRHRAGELVSGTVKRFFRGANMVVDLGKVEAIMPARNYPKTENYNVGDKVFALLEEVRDTENEGAEVVLSRSSTDFVRALVSQEVPEVSDGTVTLEAVVRDPGYRTKLAVGASDPRVDPVGACVGMRGMRVKNIVRELNNEKVDIVPYSPDTVELLQNCLAPVEIRKISINEEDAVVSIVVDDDDFPIVIGKRGMNARLTGELIGCELEVQKMNDYTRAMAVQRIQLADDEDPALDEPLQSLPGISSLLVDNLISEGFDTPRKVLVANLEQLASVPGVSLEMADKILDVVRQQRIESVGQEPEDQNQEHPAS